MHSGNITAESEGVGKGSTFTVWLPILEARSETTNSDNRETEPMMEARRRVLVVDDNRDATNSIAMMLQLLGDDTRTAHDGVEAFEVAEQFQPEFVLMNIGMPRLNGHEATRKIREQSWGRRMIIVALTGWGREEDRIQSRSAGCNGHLVKPVNLSDLEDLLAELSAKLNFSGRS